MQHDAGTVGNHQKQLLSPLVNVDKPYLKQKYFINNLDT